MKTRAVHLDAVCERIDYGFTASADFSVKEPRLLRITDIQNGSVDWNHVPGCIITPEDEADKRLSAGDIVFARTGATTGKCFLIKHAPRAVFASYLIRLRATNEVLPPYLYAFFQSELYWRQIKGAVRGAAQGGVNSTTLSSLVLPLPDLAEQRRIAGQLEQADRLRRTRRYALELTDTFLPAAFLEFFGDPLSNPKSWPTCRLEDVLLSAQDGPHVSPQYCGHGIPFLSTRNVRPGEIVWDDLKYISVADARAQWRKVKPEIGDILYTKGGTTGMAKAVDFDKEVAVWVHIAVLKLQKELVAPVWLENMLNSRFCYQQSQELTFGIVNRDLGLKRMPRIRIYLPPLTSQQEFAALVVRVERLRAVQREALRQAEHLFASLLHRAFSG